MAKSNTICGCHVDEGKIINNGIAKIFRNGQLIAKVDINSLKHYNKDVKEVNVKFNCGIGFQESLSLQIGDVIECYELRKKVK